MTAPRNLEALLDERDICALLDRYAHALDEKDWSMLRTCFTEDAVALYGEALGRKDGYAAIEEACRGALERLDSSQHMLSNKEVVIDGDRATSRCYLQAQHTKAGTAGGDNLTIGGIYLDEIVRTSEGWRIAQRELRILWQEGNQAVLA